MRPNMLQSAVWTIRTSVLALRETSDGTDPSSRPATLLSPTLPTTSRSAWTSSASCTSALIGAPTISFSSTFLAPALCARPDQEATGTGPPPTLPGQPAGGDGVAHDDAGEALRVQASCLGAPVNPASEFAQASYFVEIMRTELVEARKVAKKAQRRWSARRVNDNTEIPEHVVRLKRRVQEANRVLIALEKRFPGI